VSGGIELEKVTRVVGGEVHLADITLTLEPGSFNVLLGRTRAGKTSLLRVLAGLDRVTSGAVREGGADVTRADVRRRSVAMVYQQFVNYPSLTVFENIASPLRQARGIGAEEIDRRVREAAASLRLEGLLDRLPAELSGGQQQRTAMARALVKGARLLLLDEPLANLDYKLREELRSELKSLFHPDRGPASGDRGAIVVYATAEPAEALLLGGQTAVLHEGRLLQSGPALEVYRAPATARVGQVFSDPEMNLLEVDVIGGRRARLSSDASFTLPLPPHLHGLAEGRVALGVRAHHVRLAPVEEDDVRIPARTLLEEISGSETLLHAETGGAGGAPITAQLDGVHRHPLGAPIDLFLAGARLYAFSPEGALLAAPAADHAPLAPAAHGAD
jgi:glycerol transport system ATP-binding protein